MSTVDILRANKHLYHPVCMSCVHVKKKKSEKKIITIMQVIEY